MKNFQGMLLIVAGLAIVGCNTGETPIETYAPAPGQVTNPSAPPVQAGQPRSTQEAVQNNPNIPQVAKDAILNKR